MWDAARGPSGLCSFNTALTSSKWVSQGRGVPGRANTAGLRPLSSERPECKAGLWKIEFGECSSHPNWLGGFLCLDCLCNVLNTCFPCGRLGFWMCQAGGAYMASPGTNLGLWVSDELPGGQHFTRMSQLAGWFSQSPGRGLLVSSRLFDGGSVPLHGSASLISPVPLPWASQVFPVFRYHKRCCIAWCRHIILLTCKCRKWTCWVRVIYICHSFLGTLFYHLL